MKAFEYWWFGGMLGVLAGIPFFLVPVILIVVYIVSSNVSLGTEV